ncbi:MAG TPA: sodium:proton antiporter [Nitrospiraceae bacterium]|nr:sodium:proton antiporter [Nitrospiraceae bacterium]
MTLIRTVTILMCLSALFSYINQRWIKLPFTIGMTAMALGMSLLLVLLGKFGFGIEREAEAFISGIDFNVTVMHGLLNFLLFAGSLQVKIGDLFEQKWFIATLASIGVILSTMIVGFLGYWLFGLVGLHLPLIYCLLFGALISSTDPVAVLGILKKAKVPKHLEINITGESLFNDGTAVAVFLILFGIATKGGFTVGSGVELIVIEALGGISLGFSVGYAAYRLIKSVNARQVELLITLALVMGVHVLADLTDTSGPIAVVVAGLVIGNYSRSAIADPARDYVAMFWELLDELLNAVLFVLIGLEMLALSFKPHYLQAGLIAIPIVLLARFLSVGAPVRMFRLTHQFSRRATLILTWGGLRGGISVALALSLPEGEARDAVLTITYIVVVFSILVQGLTLGKMIEAGAHPAKVHESAAPLAPGA